MGVVLIGMPGLEKRLRALRAALFARSASSTNSDPWRRRKCAAC